MRFGEVDVELVEPAGSALEWIGQEEPMEQILACWTTITEDDLPLCPRIVGKPGMGKTTLAQAAALIWGASAISASVRQLTTTVDELKDSVRHLDKKLDNHERRVTRLETLQEIPH